MAQQSMNTDLMGASDLMRLLARNGAEVIPVLASTLYAGGQAIMRLSQAQVPFRTGALKTSGRVFEPEIQGTDVVVELGYGGDASAYAFAVHESARHFNNGKKSHYLSDPVVEGGTIIAGILATKLRGIGI